MAIIPNIVISVFFLFVYDAGLNAVENLPGFEGSYLAFILPVAILSAAVGGAGIVLFAFLWGMAFAGYAAFAALRFKNAAAAQAATLAFFPLLFLSSTFVPLEFLDGWLKVAATINPTTYVFESMRVVLMEGWEWGDLAIGLAVVVGTAAVTGALAVREAVRSTRLAG